MMEKSQIDFDISKEFEADFNIELDTEKVKEEKKQKRIAHKLYEIRKQLITIDGQIVEE